MAYNLPLMKFSFLLCGLKHTPFFNIWFFSTKTNFYKGQNQPDSRRYLNFDSIVILHANRELRSGVQLLVQNKNFVLKY